MKNLKLTKQESQLLNDVFIYMIDYINDDCFTNQDRESFDSIYSGRYAIQFYHDENQNGKLDLNLIGIPKESYGSSNDVKPVLGPPKFEKMLFNLTENKKVIMVPVN